MEQTIQLTQQEVLSLPDKQKKEITRKNLQRVLDELPELAKKMPEIIKDFDMEILGVYEDLGESKLYECSTAGCLLGNSARLFIEDFSKDLFNFGSFNTFNYMIYSIKFFPYLHDKDGFKKNNWFYLFAIKWGKTKFNKFEDALQRIKNLLDNDLEVDIPCYDTNEIIKLKNKKL